MFKNVIFVLTVVLAKKRHLFHLVDSHSHITIILLPHLSLYHNEVYDNAYNFKPDRYNKVFFQHENVFPYVH
jgi:hypothetical protein